MNGPIKRERRLRNLRAAVDIGLEEVKRNKSTLSRRLSVDFNSEMTMASTSIPFYAIL